MANQLKLSKIKLYLGNINFFNKFSAAFPGTNAILQSAGEDVSNTTHLLLSEQNVPGLK